MVEITKYLILRIITCIISAFLVFYGIAAVVRISFVMSDQWSGQCAFSYNDGNMTQVTNTTDGWSMEPNGDKEDGKKDKADDDKIVRREYYPFYCRRLNSKVGEQPRTETRRDLVVADVISIIYYLLLTLGYVCILTGAAAEHSKGIVIYWVIFALSIVVSVVCAIFMAITKDKDDIFNFGVAFFLNPSFLIYVDIFPLLLGIALCPLGFYVRKFMIDEFRKMGYVTA